MATIKSPAMAAEVLQAFDDLGTQPGFRPAHAKGILLAGRFTPSSEASSLTRAPHVQRPSTAVTVRFSDGTGIPTIPDNDPNAALRGMATRFHLAEHEHTDIIAHSVDAFPARTVGEMVEFLRAVHSSAPGTPSPSPIEKFLASHPAALEFVQAPKPIPASFFSQPFYSVTAHRFVNSSGAIQYGRYRIRPDGSNAHLSAADAAARTPDFLFDEIRQRLAKGPARMRIAVQLAAAGDVVNDSTVHWPADRREMPFGVFELMSILPDNEAAQRQIIFDPIPRVDGIEPSDDPLLDPRADVYLASGRRRRQAVISH